MTRAAPAPANSSLRQLTVELRRVEGELRQGGGAKAVERQHAKKRLTARERIDRLLDDPQRFQELGLWPSRGMYEEFGGAPPPGVVMGVGPLARHLACA